MLTHIRVIKICLRDDVMKLIVGLGNPGKEYDNTRHNIGFMILDNYLGDVKYTEKFDGLIYEKNYNGEKVIFLKPQTFMNNSGMSVVKVVNYYNIDVHDILVIHDDLDLDFNTIKIKSNSSSGGHNGIKSIINNLGSQEFDQFKFGISNEYKNNIIDFVLGKFSKEELSNIDYSYLNKVIDTYINDGVVKTMSDFN